MLKIKSNKYKYSFMLVLFFMIGIILILSSFGGSTDQKNPRLVSTNDFPQEYKIVAPSIPNNITFCDEKVPLDNFEVFERVEREFIVNTYWHSLTILTLQRANRWFPIIEPILEKNNIPDDFKYLSVTESTLLNVTSPANAVGYWQFLKSSASEYGLEVNSQIDERYHIEKSTEAACKYLQKAYNIYGNWTMAAASYNMGMSGVNEQLERQQTNNYYNLVLGEETSRYVPRILAAKIMMSNPEEYGFDIKESELYKPLETYTVTVDSGIKSWAVFAKSFGLNYKILKFYNPWLRENFLTNKSKKAYQIILPIEGSITVIPEH